MQHASAVAVPAGARASARLLRLASDERLVALVRGGDEAAFEALYDRHHAAILGFCRHMLGTREEAEDALQHTFLAAFRDLAGSAKPIELRPWLFTIARNRCLSMLRLRRPHVALELAQPATDGLSATVERREDVRELLADLARLPEDQRAALLLAELGALDHAGIAAVLGCPREKVKALVFQARSSLAASREARAMPCDQIRVDLATASGAALRRGPLRRHLRACAGCRSFKAEVAAQRGLLALALPILPSAALKASVLAGAGGAHGAAASAGAGATAGGGASGAGAALTGAAPCAGGGGLGGLLGTVASTGAAKVALTLAIAGAAAGGGAIAAREAAAPPGQIAQPADALGLQSPAGSTPAATAPQAGARAPSRADGVAATLIDGPALPAPAPAHGVHAGAVEHGHGPGTAVSRPTGASATHPSPPAHPAHPVHPSQPAQPIQPPPSRPPHPQRSGARTQSGGTPPPHGSPPRQGQPGTPGGAAHGRDPGAHGSPGAPAAPDAGGGSAPQRPSSPSAGASASAGSHAG